MTAQTPAIPTETTDVVVVGFGAAGTAAAITARELGAEVIALDRGNGGGATAISGGIIYAGGGTRVQRDAGIADTPEQMLEYLRLEVGETTDPATLRRFVDSSPEMIDWLAGYGVPFDSAVCPYKTSYPNNRYYLYYSGSENSGAFRAHTPPVQRGHRAKGRGASGKQVYAPLARSAQRLGTDFRPHTTVTELLRDDDGRVVGVQALTMAFAPQRIRRRYAAMTALSVKPGVYYPPLRAVMEGRLAALRRRYAPQFDGGLSLGTSGDDGSGIALAQSAGAVTDRMDDVSVWRFITPPSAFISAVAVNAAGERIIDESRYGAALGQELVRNHGGAGWLLVDAPMLARGRRQLLTESLWFQQVLAAALLGTRAKRGRTLDEVARKAGVDPAGLAATVAAYNAAIDAGTADPAGKPAELCARIDTGPFTLLDIGVRPNLAYPTPMLTLGGVRVDQDSGAVLDAGGAPIAGLYAAGRTALGICSRSYVSGLSIADCIFAGRRAGAAAAKA